MMCLQHREMCPAERQGLKNLGDDKTDVSLDHAGIGSKQFGEKDCAPNEKQLWKAAARRKCLHKKTGTGPIR